ncbi:GNAT family N-acetyltransferase [Telmatospirillum sp.]|uniref:GNAT family N-acetyltransferase n=1 Tax=Telmatospirillum sp. TaxID=2079197 RepID=UPI00386AC84C
MTDDPAITEMVDFLPNPFGLDDAMALIRSQGARDRFFGIWNSDCALVAVAGAHLQGSARIEIGYWVGRAFQGRGYASEIAPGLIRELDARYPQCQVMAECRPENAASWAVLRKCGLMPTGANGHRVGRQVLVRPK